METLRKNLDLKTTKWITAIIDAVMTVSRIFTLIALLIGYLLILGVGFGTAGFMQGMWNTIVDGMGLGEFAQLSDTLKYTLGGLGSIFFTVLIIVMSIVAILTFSLVLVPTISGFKTVSRLTKDGGHTLNYYASCYKYVKRDCIIKLVCNGILAVFALVQFKVFAILGFGAVCALEGYALYLINYRDSNRDSYGDSEW